MIGRSSEEENRRCGMDLRGWKMAIGVRNERGITVHPRAITFTNKQNELKR